MFKQEIKKTIGKVLLQDEHKMEPLSSDCIYFIKRYSDELAFYVRCGESIIGEITIILLFAPIRIPDDRIIRMNMGLHVDVLEVNTDECTDDILVGAGQKIVAIEKKLGSLSDMINREIEYPYFSAGIVDTYKDNLLIYNMVMKEVSLEDDIHILKSKICEYVKKKKWAPVYELCSELIGKLPNNFFTDAGINMEMGDIIDKFTIQLWAQCLLDI